MSPEGPIRRQGHDAVLGDLLDLQARLRGDPSSVTLASRPVPVDAEHRVIVRRRDLAVIHDPGPLDPEPAASATPASRADATPASNGDRRVEDLLARIDRLERVLQAMTARLDGIAPRGPGWTERDDQVRTLQRTAHDRLHRSS